RRSRYNRISLHDALPIFETRARAAELGEHLLGLERVPRSRVDARARALGLDHARESDTVGHRQQRGRVGGHHHSPHGPLADASRSEETRLNSSHVKISYA